MSKKKYYMTMNFHPWTDLELSSSLGIPIQPLSNEGPANSQGFMLVYTNKKKCAKENPKANIVTMER